VQRCLNQQRRQGARRLIVDVLQIAVLLASGMFVFDPAVQSLSLARSTPVGPPDAIQGKRFDMGRNDASDKVLLSATLSA
jgi:hypothetical protein